MSGEREIAAWLKGLPFRKRRELAEAVREEAEGLRADIKAEAPKGKTLDLSESVEVRRTRNSLVFEVTAGGERTTRVYTGRSAGYQREIKIGQGDTANVPRGSHGVSYDYALGTEFGNEHVAAQPFFFSTARARGREIQQRLAEKVARIMVSE